tara:strand:- start:15108 stop:16232 length:1125 start_codon:yes stop_codon:yes gene_type:complete
MKQCEAWIVRGANKPFERTEVSLDDLRPDEVLVEVTASGICHMDLEAKDLVPLPAIFGHEGVGRVTGIGAAVEDVAVGDRVIMTYAACGRCGSCVADAAYHCEDSWDVTFSGLRADGSPTIFENGQAISAAFFQQSSFGRYAITPARGVVRVDEDCEIDDTLLAALPCGVLTGAGVVARQFAFTGGEELAVFGVGAVGLSAVMAARKLGAKSILAVDVKPSRLALARELGATHVINPAQEADSVASIKRNFPRGLPFVIDTSGNATAFHSATRILRTGGRLAVCILPSPMEEFQFKPFDLFVRAATMEAVSFGNADAREFLPHLLSWYAAGEFPVDRIVTVFPFSQLNEAVEAAIGGEAIKPVLDFISVASKVS